MLKRTELQGLDALQDMTELTLWTAYVKEEKIVSLLIIGKPESGRTELVKKYAQHAGIVYRERFTARGILEELMKGNIKVLFDGKEKILGHIVVPQFSSVLSYNPKSIDQTITFLCSLTEEGLASQSSYWIKGADLNDFIGLKGGIIAVVNTADFFNRKTGKVKQIFFEGGWLSRNIAWASDEPEETTNAAFRSFEKGDYHPSTGFLRRIHMDFPDRRIKVCTPKRITRKITELATDIAFDYNEDLEDSRVEIRGKRIWKSLASLIKASALRSGRRVVNDDDYERIKYLSRWFNLKMKPLKPNYPFRRY